MKKQSAPVEMDVINEALAELILKGLVEVFVNEEGERIFRLKEVYEGDE